jgi:hypothetical protein
MKKGVGYIVSIVGLIVMAISFSLLKVDLPGNFPSLYITIAGVILIVVGIIISLKDKRTGKQKKKEVPIYEGEEIIGYRRG